MTAHGRAGDGPELSAIAARIAGRANAGEQVEAYVVRSSDTEVRVFEGDVEKFSDASTAGVGVRVIRDHREGYAYAGSLADADLDFALSEARDNANFSQADEHAGLASPADAASAPLPDLDLWRDDLAGISPELKINLALELDRAVRDADSRIRGADAVGYEDAAVEVAISTSTGVIASSRRTSCVCFADVIAGDGDETQTGYGYSIGRTFSDLDPMRAAADATGRALRLLGAKPIPTCRLPVLLDPLVTRSFLGLLGTALSGDSLSRGRSFFAGRAGEDVAAGIVSLVDDPTDPLAFSAASADGEGVPARRFDLVSAGVLRGFAHHVVSARRAGAATTGSATRGYTSAPAVGFRNLHMVPGDTPGAALLASIGDGFYVQAVQGLHSGANPVSGDFSTGATGARIRGGELAEPVREVTVASTLQRMLLDVVAVGSDAEHLPGGLSSSLLISEMTVSGS